MDKKFVRIFNISFFSILIFIGLVNLVHIHRTVEFNNLEREISPNRRDCLFELKPRGGITDSWDKVDVDVGGKICTLTGTTYDGVFTNNSDNKVSDWKLRINAVMDCYVNKAWCGNMEIHQFRNGKESVQTLDLRNCTRDDLKLEFVEIGQDLLISLKNGDYIVYQPSKEASEFPVNSFNGSSGSVTIGMIFYYLKNQQIILDDYLVKFKFHRSLFQGYVPKVSFIVLIFLAIAGIIQFSIEIAYKKARIEAEKMMNIQKIRDLQQFNEEITEANRQLEETNSVISAISEIYTTLYKVDLEKDSFSCVRANEMVYKFINRFDSAELALNSLPEEMFLAEDKEAVKKFFNLKTWKEKLRTVDICSADFRGKYTGWLRTNLIVAKRNEKGEAVEVLVALQDVNKIVKDEMEKKQKLEIANKVMKSYNETLNEEIKLRLKHIKEIQQKVVIGLASVIGNRDSDTGGHVNRTSDIIKIIVDEIRNQNEEIIDEQKAFDIVRAAPMHDLGKIYISPSILCKPGKLTVEEYEKMKEHSVNSGDIVNLVLKDVEEEHFVQTAFNVARFHHERWDGNGYPNKLSGEEIPLEARIMAIADVYDALVSRRCYKQPMSFESAYEIMCEGMGSQFDPKLKSIFIACRERLESYYSGQI
ncbi:MAG: HD domain-containing protein [Treponema sp.]|nr:HD domain-containing protein [Candidatus Treponema equifaecale]